MSVDSLLNQISNYFSGVQPHHPTQKLTFPLPPALPSLTVEIIGWAGRLWSHFAIYSDGYMMQICCLTIAPTFISAGLYVTTRFPVTSAPAALASVH